MSSAPVGIDVREYAYGLYSFTTSDGSTKFYSTNQAWLITRIQAFSPASLPTFLGLAGHTVPIFAGGCVTLEPNGGYRGTLSYGGNTGGLLLIEYWYQSRPTGAPPIVVVT